MNKIQLSNIQPLERCLRKSTVDYFLENIQEAFRKRQSIEIMSVENQPFQFYARNGNHRLYSLYTLGITEIPETKIILNRGKIDDNIELIICLENFNDNFKNWSDLDNHLLSDEHYYLSEITGFSDLSLENYQEWAKNNLNKHKKRIKQMKEFNSLNILYK